MINESGFFSVKISLIAPARRDFAQKAKSRGGTLVTRAYIREFKIRRLRTTATDKHATAHDQNHVTVHFSCVALRLR